MSLVEKLDKRAKELDAQVRSSVVRFMYGNEGYDFGAADLRELLEQAAKRLKGTGSMSGLTDDERAVLMIAADGKSMLAIGRWQKPVENLTLLGLLQKLDPFNYVITPNGRKILAERQNEEDEDFRRAFSQLVDAQNAREQTVISGNQSATHLMMAAKAAAKISGLTPEQEVWQIGQGTIQRALELLKSP